MSNYYQLFFYVSMYFLVNLVYWIAIFMPAALDGHKLYAGLSLGVSEASSALVCGLFCKYFSDIHYLMLSTSVVLVSQCIFFFVYGGVYTNFYSLVFNYTTVFGLGLLYCAIIISIK